MKNRILFFVCITSSLLFSSCDEELMDMTEPGLLVPKTVDQDLTLPSLNVNNYLLHVESFGNPADPIVIMIHGGPGGDYRSLLNAKDLVKDGYFVVFYDQVGSGLSKRVDKNIFDKKGSINIFLENLLAIITHFRQSDTQKVFLAGHSWGAILATGFINKYPNVVNGIALAEPGGLTWDQTEDYVTKVREVKLFSETTNDIFFPDQMFVGRDQHEILDYKMYFSLIKENEIEYTLGHPEHYPRWRNGAVIANASSRYAAKFGFDFQDKLDYFIPKVLFMYSEHNKIYGEKWAQKVSAPFINKDLQMVKGTGHEMYFFGWDEMYPILLNYLNELK